MFVVYPVVVNAEATAPVNQTAAATPTAQTTPAATQTGYDSTQPVRSTAPAYYTPTGVNDPNNLQAFNQQNEQRLNTMYDANRENALA